MQEIKEVLDMMETSELVAGYSKRDKWTQNETADCPLACAFEIYVGDASDVVEYFDVYEDCIVLENTWEWNVIDKFINAYDNGIINNEILSEAFKNKIEEDRIKACK